MLTFEEITKNEAIKTYITRADESLLALGYTEHSFSHVLHVARTAGYILDTLGYDARTVEIAKIAGYLHDIGNLVNRQDHSQSGAVQLTFCAGPLSGKLFKQMRKKFLGHTNPRIFNHRLIHGIALYVRWYFR